MLGAGCSRIGSGVTVVIICWVEAFVSAYFLGGPAGWFWEASRYMASARRATAMTAMIARMPIISPASAINVVIPVTWLIEFILELIAANSSFMLVIWYCK